MPATNFTVLVAEKHLHYSAENHKKTQVKCHLHFLLQEFPSLVQVLFCPGKTLNDATISPSLLGAPSPGLQAQMAGAGARACLRQHNQAATLL